MIEHWHGDFIIVMFRQYLRPYIIPFSEFLKSLKLRSVEYLRENTLHGFIYFADPYRSLWERVIWFFCTIFSLINAVIFIIVIWQRFQLTPTITDLDINTDSMEIIYPNVHLCMASKYLNMTGIPENLANIYRQYYQYPYPDDSGDVKLPAPLHKIYPRITPDCDSLFTNCTKQGFSTNCSKMFEKVLTPAGVCCRSLRKKYTLNEDPPILTFKIRENNTLNLYLHDHDEPPTGGPLAIDYSLNRNVEFALQVLVTDSDESLRTLSLAQRDCVFPDEGGTYRSCIVDCAKNGIFEVCGCYLWSGITTVRNKECPFNKYSSCIKTAKLEKCPDKCYLGCSHTRYAFAKIKNSNVTSIRLWWPTVKFNRKVRFSWLDLLVSFGGIMGLFIGYSLLTSVEIIYYFTLRSYCGAVVRNIEKRASRKIRVAERKKPKKIEMIYYDYVD